MNFSKTIKPDLECKRNMSMYDAALHRKSKEESPLTAVREKKTNGDR